MALPAPNSYIGDPSAPTLVSRSYFDTGRTHEAMKGKLLRPRPRPRMVACHDRLGKQLWGLAAAATVMAFAATSVVNYQTMVKLADTEETEIVAHRGFIAGGVENTLTRACRATAQGRS